MVNQAARTRRELQRDLNRRGEQAFAKGLAPVPSETDMAAAALVLARKLADTANVRRASETARLAHALFERSLAAYPAPETLACRKGCAHCCQNYVSISAPEALLAARAVRAAETARASLARPLLLARMNATIGLSPDERAGKRLPCPLLDAGSCTIYAERPIMCRQVVALDAEPCRREADGEDVRVPGVARFLSHASNGGLALVTALVANGRPVAFYELSAAVRAALEMPDAEARWLAGEDIFASAQHSPVPAQIRGAAARLAITVRTYLPG